jgi:phosphate-selective porin OprO/OprP
LLGDFGFREKSSLRDWSVRAQVDFADSDIRWLDLAGTYAGLPTIEAGAVGRVRFGQFRESFGLEAMTSVSHLAFIERSTASNAFTPGRSRGVEWSETGGATVLQVGAFRRADGGVFPSELQEETAFTARALWQRGRDELGGIQLVQLGASVSVRDPGADRLRFDARPGSRLFDRIVDSGGLDADGAVTMGLEALTQWGQSTLVTEIFGADVRGVSNSAGTSASGGFLSGAHVGFTTFLTSGHAARWHRRRGGLRSAAVEDAILGDAPTSGALEAAVRLSWVNLNSGPVQGGRSADLEAGLNWYLQPTTRFMLHWLGTRARGANGRTGFGHAILARIQVQL